MFGISEVGRALLEKHEAYVRRHGSDSSVAEVCCFRLAWTTAADVTAVRQRVLHDLLQTRHAYHIQPSV